MIAMSAFIIFNMATLWWTSMLRDADGNTTSDDASDYLEIDSI